IVQSFALALEIDLIENNTQPGATTTTTNSIQSIMDLTTTSIKAYTLPENNSTLINTNKHFKE
ncbi:10573_t:CDS:1, partial [Dentiscutata heterogama]